MSSEFPTVSALTEATIYVISQANRELKNDEIAEEVITYLKISKETASIIHSGNRTELDYRLAWARTKASKSGAIVRVAPATWKIAR